MNITTKICKKCFNQLDKIYFPKSKRSKDGLDTLCKKCRNKVNEIYRKENIGKVKESRKKYYNSNLEKMRKAKREYYAVNFAKKKVYDVIYRKQNIEKIRQYKKTWENNNKDKICIKIKRNLRRRLNHVIKRECKFESVISLLSCTFEDFLQHIQDQFEQGMSWENYGKFGWHIDHIRPCYKFDLTKEEEQKECFNYKNLRPLWWHENLSRRRNI